MIKLLTLKLKIILGFLILIVGLIIGGYVYLNKMTVKTGNLNINKTNSIDKLCNYTIFSDFYYHITDYSNGGNSFAQLTPVKTDICYNFKSKKIELKPNVTNNYIILDDNKGEKVDKKIALLENFQEDYSKIVATQDKDYFIKSYELAQQTYKTLYNEELPMKPKDVSDYYTNILNLPIENLVINHYKLTKIKNTPKQALKDGEWQPNILEWNFGENDKIYFKYVRKLLNNDLDKFVNSIYSKKKKTIVKLTKFNNNKLSKMFLVFDDINNKISVFFMDKNGYLYTLILKVQNPKAFDTYFNDFMKIAYGIYFIDVDGFVNEWATKQKDAILYLNASLNTGIEIVENWNKLHEFPNCSDILDKYSEVAFITDFIDWNDEFIIAYSSSLDEKFNKFKSKYGYPTDDIFSQFNDANENLKLINEGVEKLTFPLLYLGCDVLQEECPNSLECIKDLKNNNWETTDE